MIRWETIEFPAAGMGEENPLADIGNIEYIHAGYEVTAQISEEEKGRIGRGMIGTILPYTIQDNFNRVRVPRRFHAAIVENEYLRATFLPELGGRLWSLYDKEHGKELLYVNPVFQPANLAIRNAWFSGGVEFNVGIKGHNPLTCDPYFARIAHTAAGEEVLQIYEYERIRGTVFGINAYLPAGSRVLYLRDTIENPQESETWTYWWSNIAVPETKETRVIVPTGRSFLSTYDDGHYVLDKTDIPFWHGVDASYPTRLRRSLDFFYEIPKESHERWIAAVEGDGSGLAQLSTKEMLGRKLFVWGQGQGGRNWGKFLSDGSAGYIEIQAGLAYTQLEHIPMPGKTTFSWTEAYTGIACDPATVFSADWQQAQAEAGRQIHSRLGADDLHVALEHAVPTDFVSYDVLAYGSGFAALEEREQGMKLSGIYDFYPSSCTEKQAPWLSLIEKGYLPAQPAAAHPASYVIGKRWQKRLLASCEREEGRHWFTYYHLGIIAYQQGQIEEAEGYFRTSLSCTDNAWARRNLALIALHRKQTAKAADGMLAAVALCPACVNLYPDAMRCLLADGRYPQMEAFYAAAPEKVKARGRMRLLLAMAYMRQEAYEKAATIINPDFQMDDIREGEISLSHLWFDLYRALLRKQHPSESEEQIAARQQREYPLPAYLDFRMHDESEHD
ncbi:MAG: DUF5107 domain-containing protein [Clostridia bacterium]|nr:DUF5107 domain-containing protein [Clostridia bacterium]